GALDAREAGGDALQPFQALDVALQRLAARARPGGGDGVGGIDDAGVERRGEVEVVVVGDGVDDLLRLAEAPAQVGADLGVGAVYLAVDRFAYVVKQTGAARHRLVDAELGGDYAAQVRHLHGVLQDVLREAGAELHAPQELD